MIFLQGLHGVVAAILICSLLFVDEAGLPLPIAPNEGLLLIAGILVASGELPIWAIFPLAYASMAAGMVTGYGWARTVGQAGLQSVAERVRAQGAYERAQNRLKSASPLGIGLARMIPGLRPYATLVSGAAKVDLRTFLLGSLPALLIWEALWLLAGMLVGLPLAHLLGRFEKVVLRAGVLVALGTVAWFAVRDESPDRRGGLAGVAPRLRATLALVVDAGIVFAVNGGLFGMGRRLLHIHQNAWIEPTVGACLLGVLLIYGRTRQTPGETLFDTHYWHLHDAA